MALRSTIPLIPWMSTKWNRYSSGFGWIKLCDANKYRTTISFWSETGDWYIDPDGTGIEHGIYIPSGTQNVKLEFKHYGTFIQQELYGIDSLFSGTINVFELIWKPLIRSN